jgi:hypothetical protein
MGDPVALILGFALSAVDRRGAVVSGVDGQVPKNSLVIASNDSFGGWTRTFTDPQLRAAIVWSRPPGWRWWCPG